MQKHSPLYERQAQSGDHRPRFRRTAWAWLCVCLALPFASFLLACAVQSLISLVLLFWLVGELYVQLLIWWFGPYLLPLGFCVLALLLYEHVRERGPRFPEGRPKDGDS